jgi:hypothetical protein
MGVYIMNRINNFKSYRSNFNPIRFISKQLFPKQTEKVSINKATYQVASLIQNNTTDNRESNVEQFAILLACNENEVDNEITAFKNDILKLKSDANLRKQVLEYYIFGEKKDDLLKNFQSDLLKKHITINAKHRNSRWYSKTKYLLTNGAMDSCKVFIFEDTLQMQTTAQEILSSRAQSLLVGIKDLNTLDKINTHYDSNNLIQTTLADNIIKETLADNIIKDIEDKGGAYSDLKKYYNGETKLEGNNETKLQTLINTIMNKSTNQTNINSDIDLFIMLYNIKMEDIKKNTVNVVSKNTVNVVSSVQNFTNFIDIDFNTDLIKPDDLSNYQYQCFKRTFIGLQRKIKLINWDDNNLKQARASFRGVMLNKKLKLDALVNSAKLLRKSIKSDDNKSLNVATLTTFVPNKLNSDSLKMHIQEIDVADTKIKNIEFIYENFELNIRNFIVDNNLSADTNERINNHINTNLKFFNGYDIRGIVNYLSTNSTTSEDFKNKFEESTKAFINKLSVLNDSLSALYKRENLDIQSLIRQQENKLKTIQNQNKSNNPNSISLKLNSIKNGYQWLIDGIKSYNEKITSYNAITDFNQMKSSNNSLTEQDFNQIIQANKNILTQLKTKFSPDVNTQNLLAELNGIAGGLNKSSQTAELIIDFILIKYYSYMDGIYLQSNKNFLIGLIDSFSKYDVIIQDLAKTITGDNLLKDNSDFKIAKIVTINTIRYVFFKTGIVDEFEERLIDLYLLKISNKDRYQIELNEFTNNKSIVEDLVDIISQYCITTTDIDALNPSESSENKTSIYNKLFKIFVFGIDSGKINDNIDKITIKDKKITDIKKQIGASSVNNHINQFYSIIKNDAEILADYAIDENQKNILEAHEISKNILSKYNEYKKAYKERKIAMESKINEVTNKLDDIINQYLLTSADYTVDDIVKCINNKYFINELELAELRQIKADINSTKQVLPFYLKVSQLYYLQSEYNKNIEQYNQSVAACQELQNNIEGLDAKYQIKTTPSKILLNKSFAEFAQRDEKVIDEEIEKYSQNINSISKEQLTINNKIEQLKKDLDITKQQFIKKFNDKIVSISKQIGVKTASIETIDKTITNALENLDKLLLTKINQVASINSQETGEKELNQFFLSVKFLALIFAMDQQNQYQQIALATDSVIKTEIEEYNKNIVVFQAYAQIESLIKETTVNQYSESLITEINLLKNLQTKVNQIFVNKENISQFFAKRYFNKILNFLKKHKNKTSLNSDLLVKSYDELTADDKRLIITTLNNISEMNEDINKYNTLINFNIKTFLNTVKLKIEELLLHAFNDINNHKQIFEMIASDKKDEKDGKNQSSSEEKDFIIKQSNTFQNQSILFTSFAGVIPDFNEIDNSKNEDDPTNPTDLTLAKSNNQLKIIEEGEKLSKLKSEQNIIKALKSKKTREENNEKFFTDFITKTSIQLQLIKLFMNYDIKFMNDKEFCSMIHSVCSNLHYVYEIFNIENNTQTKISSTGWYIRSLNIQDIRTIITTRLTEINAVRIKGKHQEKILVIKENLLRIKTLLTATDKLQQNTVDEHAMLLNFLLDRFEVITDGVNDGYFKNKIILIYQNYLNELFLDGVMINQIDITKINSIEKINEFINSQDNMLINYIKNYLQANFIDKIQGDDYYNLLSTNKIGKHLIRCLVTDPQNIEARINDIFRNEYMYKVLIDKLGKEKVLAIFIDKNISDKLLQLELIKIFTNKFLNIDVKQNIPLLLNKRIVSVYPNKIADDLFIAITKIFSEIPLNAEDTCFDWQLKFVLYKNLEQYISLPEIAHLISGDEYYMHDIIKLLLNLAVYIYMRHNIYKKEKIDIFLERWTLNCEGYIKNTYCQRFDIETMNQNNNLGSTDKLNINHLAQIDGCIKFIFTSLSTGNYTKALFNQFNTDIKLYEIERPRIAFYKLLNKNVLDQVFSCLKSNFSLQVLKSNLQELQQTTQIKSIPEVIHNFRNLELTFMNTSDIYKR